MTSEDAAALRKLCELQKARIAEVAAERDRLRKAFLAAKGYLDAISFKPVGGELLPTPELDALYDAWIESCEKVLVEGGQ